MQKLDAVGVASEESPFPLGTALDQSHRTRFGDVRGRYLRAQLEGNRREALRLVIEEGIAAGMSALDVQIEIIQAAQREIGQLWQENQISIAEEHMATAISHMALAHLYDRAERAPSNGKRVTVACVEGELHDFPARLVADALDLAGFEVRYLGASVPTESLVALIGREPCDLIALSATMAFNVPALRAAVAQIRSRAWGGLPIVIGGGACEWLDRIAVDLAVQGTASDAVSAVQLVSELLGVEPASPAQLRKMRS